jgi:hypothetical protein
MLVLEDHRNGDVLGREPLLDESSFDPLPAAHFVGGSGLPATDPHEALLDHTPRGAPAHAEVLSDEFVQTLAGLFGRHFEVVAVVVAVSSQLSAFSRGGEGRSAVRFRILLRRRNIALSILLLVSLNIHHRRYTVKRRKQYGANS